MESRIQRSEHQNAKVFLEKKYVKEETEKYLKSDIPYSVIKSD